MEMTYTQENVIQGITIHNTDANFDQSIIDLMEIINENQFYTCHKLGRRLLIGKTNTSDIMSVVITKITSINILNDEICINTDAFQLSISNNESQFILY